MKMINDEEPLPQSANKDIKSTNKSFKNTTTTIKTVQPQISPKQAESSIGYMYIHTSSPIIIKKIL